MDLWHHKEEEWVTLDHVVKVVCGKDIKTELPFLYSFQILLYRYNLSSFFSRGMMLRERW